jgi:hypothetical protein
MVGRGRHSWWVALRQSSGVFDVRRKKERNQLRKQFNDRIDEEERARQMSPPSALSHEGEATACVYKWSAESALFSIEFPLSMGPPCSS